MSRVVERQLITCTPRKNHEAEGKAEDTTKGKKPFGFRNPSLTRPLQIQPLVSFMIVQQVV
jgi:hypothetical protein